MLVKRLCAYNVGLKVDMSREIDCGYVILQKHAHTIVRRVFCFWQFALLFLGLVTHYREF